MTFTFDFTNTLIYIPVAEKDVDIQDLINQIRDAEASEIGITYDKIANASGKESLGTSVTVGITIELLGTWQLKFEDGNYIASVSGGNLVGGLGGDPIAYSPGVQTLLLQSAASTIVNVTGGGTGDCPTADEIATAVVSRPISGLPDGTLGKTVEETKLIGQNTFAVTASK